MLPELESPPHCSKCLTPMQPGPLSGKMLKDCLCDLPGLPKGVTSRKVREKSWYYRQLRADRKRC